MEARGSRQVACFFAGALAFSLVAGAEAFSGWMTPGDFLANGNRLVGPSYWLSAIVGILVGYRTRGPAFRVIIVLAMLAALWYCLIVPDGWWVHPPPP